MRNVFVLKQEEYKRDLNLLKHYLEDTSLYLSLQTKQPIEVCREFVKKAISKDGAFPFKDPKIVYLKRQENGDRVQLDGTLLNYINESIKDNEFIAPTLTTYLHPKVKESLLLGFIERNVAKRNVAKKAKFAAKIAKNKTLMIIKDTEQSKKKISNNSISGAHLSASTPLFNRTAHSTLTSVCRITSGYGNANNEKILSGNRHYWSLEIAINNVVSIVNRTDYTTFTLAMNEYGLVYPSVEDTVKCIMFSLNLYVSRGMTYKYVLELIETLTDIQRAAVVYTGDLYHLMKLNPEMVRDFITALSSKCVNPVNKEEVMKDVSGDILIFVNQLCSTDLRGTSLHDIKNTPAYETYTSTVDNVKKTLDKYSLFIKAILVTESVPASLGYLPDSIRRSAITSDTDSTIFTVQDWIKWYFGEISFGERPTAVAATVIFIAAQSIIHVLAKMSANLGVVNERVHQITMKNEFKFDVFVPTQVSKHYYALISCQEGNIFSEMEEEIKGVHLKSSNVPKEIMKKAKELMISLMEDTMEGKKFKINDILTYVADIERDIFKSIKRGDSEFFRKGQIKPSNAYKNGETTSQYQQYLFWRDVFGPKYMETQPPPYTTIKASVDLNSTAKTNEWIASIEDKVLSDRIVKWMTLHGKTNLGNTLLLPEAVIRTIGIPDEIYAAIDSRKIVIDCVNVFYIILESLGIFVLNNKKNRLCSDTH